MNVDIRKGKLIFGQPVKIPVSNESTIKGEKINNLAQEIAESLNPNNKRRYVISLLTTINSLEKNKDRTIKYITPIANFLGIGKQELDELNLIVLNNFPPPKLYYSSIITGNCKPELAKEFNGLRFFCEQNCPADFWIYKMESSHYIVVKTIANQSSQFQNTFIPGSITLLDEDLINTFKNFNIKINAIISDLQPSLSELFELTVPKTEFSPLIILDPSGPKITISGRSIMLDANAFYLPVFTWLATFRFNKHTSLDIHFSFDLMNTQTCRMLASLFFRCKKLENSGVKVNYYWIYSSDDDDLKQFGIEMQSLIEARFKFIEKEVYE